MSRTHPDHLTLWLMGPPSACDQAAFEVAKWMRASSRGSHCLGRDELQTTSPLWEQAIELNLQAKRRPGGRPGFNLRRWQVLLYHRHPRVTVLMCWTNFKLSFHAPVDDEPRALATVELWPSSEQPPMAYPPHVWRTSTVTITDTHGLASHVSFRINPAMPFAPDTQRGLATTGLSIMSGEALSQVKDFLKAQQCALSLEHSFSFESQQVVAPALERF